MASGAEPDRTAAQPPVQGENDSAATESCPEVVVGSSTAPSADSAEAPAGDTLILARNPGSHPNSGDESDITPRSEVPSESPAIYQSFPQLQQQKSSEPGYFSPRPVRYHQAAFPTAASTSTEPSPVQATGLAAPPSDVRRATPPNDDEPSVESMHPTVERPALLRDLTSSSTASTSTVRASTADHLLSSPGLRRQRTNELPPIVSPAVVSSGQFHHPPAAPHVLRTRSSHPSQHSSYSTSHVATLAHPYEGEPSRQDPLSRTAGNSPASSPGLFTPKTPSARPYEENGFYTGPYLHFTQRHAPKETHVADVDVDPISGRKIINQYEVIDELGRGVHGKVKLGRNLETQDYVAIKIVERFSKRPRLGKNTSHEDKIRREIAILKKARHPNIVSLLEVIDDPSRKKVYIVLEHVEMGEVRWRTEAPREVSMVDYRRYQRSRRRQKKRERQRLRELQGSKVSGFESGSWSLEHGNGSDDEHSDTLSRVSSSLSQGPTGENFGMETAIRDSSGVGSVTGLQQFDNWVGAHVATPNSFTSKMSDYDLAGKRKTSVASSISTLQSEYDEIPEYFRYVPLMSLPAARAAIRDTVLGLEYLHYQGVIHRDIKPANLLQTKDHHIKISDFGVSYLGRPSAGGVTDDQSESDAPGADDAIELAKTVGTPAFYAPELCQTDEDAEAPPVTNAIDVWSVGVTLYCLVFGRVPFHHHHTFGMMKMIAEEEVHIPRVRLKAVDETESSRHRSRSRMYSPPKNEGNRAPAELVYEDVEDDLYDLLSRLLIKDPRRRITLREVKEHPWLLRDITDKAAWVDETAPERQTGQRIHVTREDVDDAVVSIDLMDKLKSGFRKVRGVLGFNSTSSTSRNRAKSSAAGSEQGPPSNASSSSTISQDGRREGRRRSLRVDDAVFAALKHSRDREDRRQPHSVAATPDVRERPQFFLGSNSRPQSPTQAADWAPRPHQHYHSHNHFRPQYTERSTSTMSTAASSNTIRPSDLSQAGGGTSAGESLLLPSIVPATPVEGDHAGGSGLSSLLSGVNRLAFGRRDRSTSVKSTDSRGRSIDRLKGGSDDPHCEPSVALSSAFAAGQVDQPPLTTRSEPLYADEEPPTTRKLSQHSDIPPLLPHGYVPSRQSSISSSSSHRHSLYSVREEKASPADTSELAFLHQVTPEDRNKRAREESIRRRLLEEQRRAQPPSTSHSRSISTQSQPACPLSPDDEIYPAALRRNSAALERDPHAGRDSSLDTSPMTQPSNLRLLNSSSSEDHFREDISQSTSYPSIPSVASADETLNKMASAPPYSPYVDQYNHSYTSNPPPAASDPPPTSSAIDEEGYDESADDENDGLTMAGPKKSVARTRVSVSASTSRRRTRRDTGSRRSRHGGGGSTGGADKVPPADLGDDEDTALAAAAADQQVLASSESAIKP